MDSLGFPQVCMDNQKHLVDKTMLRQQCKTFNNVKLAFALTFIIVSFGTNLIVEEHDQALMMEALQFMTPLVVD